MKVKISIPRIPNYPTEFEWDITTNFKPRCLSCPKDKTHGFAFRSAFEELERSGKDSLEGVIFCISPGCPQCISFKMRRVDTQ